MIFVRDEIYYNLLPEKLDRLMGESKRTRVMALPPLGIQTLAPIVRRQGHQVQMFDTCHPQMKTMHILQAVKEQRPDVIAFSLLSVTTYRIVKSMTKQIKAIAPSISIIIGGVFASGNAVQILRDCESVDCVGIGEGEELLSDYLDNINDPGAVAGLVWRRGDEIISNETRSLFKRFG